MCRVLTNSSLLLSDSLYSALPIILRPKESLGLYLSRASTGFYRGEVECSSSFVMSRVVKLVNPLKSDSTKRRIALLVLIDSRGEEMPFPYNFYTKYKLSPLQISTYRVVKETNNLQNNTITKQLLLFQLVLKIYLLFFI